MLYDIYFHNDFDGRAASAVMLAFLRSRGDDIEHFTPVKYDLIPQWVDEDFFNKHMLFEGRRNPAIIVDFPFHPKAAFWFDHHVRPFRKPAWEKKFKSDPSHRFNENYKSACSLVYDSLKKDFGWKPPAHLKELVRWLDILDYANYKSAKQTIAMKEPAIQLNNFIEEHSSDDPLTIWTIQKIATVSLNNLVKVPRIKKDIQALRKHTGTALDFYRDRMKTVDEVMVTDLTGYPFAELGHYAPYYLHPKKRYAIRFHPFPGKPSLFHINVGANPWRRAENKKNIGEMLKKFDGGGHKDVGGAEVAGRKKTEKVVGEIVAFLNKK